MPVSSTSVFVDCSTRAGAFRWIGLRRTCSGIGLLSIGSPSTLKMRPSVASPTGTVMGPPAATASIPRTSPSVGPMAMHRTISSPRCCATSTVSRLPSFFSIQTASFISGRTPPLNLMSRTAPITWVIVPVFCAVISLLLFLSIQSFRS